MSFANIFCWQDSYHSQIALWQGWLLVRFTIDGHTAYMQPIGEGDICAVVEVLAADAQSLGEPLRLYGLNDQWQSELERLFPQRFAFYASPDNADYIYLASDLATLAGRRYQPKRNFINRFVSRYNYRFEPLTADNLEDALYLNAVWCRQKGVSSTDAEQLALSRAFDSFFELNLEGWILYADGSPCAFAVGSAVNYDTFCIHIEKSDIDVEGAGAMINNLTAVELAARYKYINREDDLGLEGLRRAKQSYYPVELLTKHSALQLADYQMQLRELWIDTFGDDRSTIDHFFVRHFDPALCFTHTVAGRVVAMLYVVPLISAQSRVAYIYAVATSADFRRQGIASALMSSALRSIEQAGFDYAALIPADSYATRFYERFGFSLTDAPFDFSPFDTDYDLGTGTAERNVAMVRKFL